MNDTDYLLVGMIGIVCFMLVSAYVYGEVQVCRHRGDVYEWTKKLTAWLDKK